MSTPKDQHYIPRMLLKRFTDKEGNLYFMLGPKNWTTS